MSQLSELLNIQDSPVPPVALEGAVRFRRAGLRSLLFAYKNRQRRSFL